MAGRPRGRRLLLGIGLCWAITISFIAPSFSASGGSARALSLINSSRQSAGLAGVSGDSSLNSIAQRHAERMAAEGRIFHSSFSGTSDANSWGENVGRGPDVDSVHRAFMSSSTHRGNILNKTFTHVGIGVAAYSGGVMVVHDFVGRAGSVVQQTQSKPRVRVANRTPAAPAPPPPPPPPPPVAEMVGGRVEVGGAFSCGIRDIEIPPEEGGSP
ncbi:MAG: CAP domain-containing protein [Actinobacteria bacterium]|nr:CAP domain-containing protein [Actinomycetota bacterium]